jgi:hypothetical protein
MKKKILLTKDRPVTNISMRIPVDVIETLKKVATLKEMSGYQSLIKYYIGQGLLNDNDLVSRIEEEEEDRLNAADVEAALEKIALEREKIDDFWNTIGKTSPRKRMMGS